MRKKRQSRTLAGAAVALVSSLVALVLGLLVQFGVLEMLEAAAVTGLVAPVVSAFGAVLAWKGRMNPQIKAIARGRALERPKIPRGLKALLLVPALFISGWAGGGCGTSFTCQKSYIRHLQPSKPFHDNAVCDGELVFEAAGPVNATFKVRCPDRRPPYFDADGIVRCPGALEVKP